MWLYRSIRFAVILLRVTLEGGGPQLTADQYHPFIWCQDSRWRGGGSVPISLSTSSPASSILRLRSPSRIVLIARPSLRMSSWSLAGYRRAENLLLKILHLATDIHAFFRASLDLGSGTALLRAVKSLTSLVGGVGGRRGSHLRLLSYLECSLRGKTRRHPRTN